MAHQIRCWTDDASPKKKKENAGASPKKKMKKPKKLSSKVRRKRESEKQKRINEYKRRERDLYRKRGLHEAAKWKRILSQCDYWFSDINLRQDDYMRGIIKKHEAWIPVRELLTFPKFHHWVTAQLIVDACQSSAAKRYKVKYPSKPEKSDKVKQKKESTKLPTIEKELPPQPPESSPEESFAVKKPEVAVKKPEPEAPAHQENWLRRTLQSVSVFQTVTSIFTSESSPPQSTKSNVVEGDHQTAHRQVETSANIDDMEESEDESDNDDDDHGTLSDEDSDDEFPSDNEDDTVRDDAHCFGDVDPVEEDDTQALATEEDDLPQFVQEEKDTEKDPMKALVGHRRVNLEYILFLEQQINDEERLQREGKGLEDAGDGKDAPKPKKKQFRNYSTKREVIVAQNATQLKDLCTRLRSAAEQTSKERSGDSKASVIGFDVEYCTLELDIRNNLPAMLQLASPNKKGPVGLVWLDKFPDHGRNMLHEQDCAPLTSLLADPAILKVGVGASKDAANLTRWWGVNDNEYASHFVTGVVDLEEDERLLGKRLSDMCEEVLDRRLAKQKQSKQQKMKVKRGAKKKHTAHWRRDSLTDEMKKYAVNDVACGVDVWMKIHGFRDVK